MGRVELRTASLAGDREADAEILRRKVNKANGKKRKAAA
jgi:hypothetical protein